MSLVFNNDFNFNGVSQINATEGETPIVLLSVSASYHNDNKLYFSKTVENIEKYIANKEVADADYLDFETKVYEVLTSPTQKSTK